MEGKGDFPCAVETNTNKLPFACGSYKTIPKDEGGVEYEVTLRKGDEGEVLPPINIESAVWMAKKGTKFDPLADATELTSFRRMRVSHIEV